MGHGLKERAVRPIPFRGRVRPVVIGTPAAAVSSGGACAFYLYVFCEAKKQNNCRVGTFTCGLLDFGGFACLKFFCSGAICFRSKRVDRCVGVEHEEYLEAVDLTSYVGTIPTWLASYFLV